MYIIRESFLQAWSQLMANKLRSFLSLLGIVIGIFCYISVKSAVDSLEMDVRKSFDKLGNDVIYITKLPWNEDPDENYWKYARRPNPSYRDYKVLTDNVESAKLATYSFFAGAKTVKYDNNSVEGAFALAVTGEYDQFHELNFAEGRFFSPAEYQLGMNRVVLGHKVAEELFGDKDPIGREIKAFGRDMTVVGVLKKNGKSLINIYNYDNILLVGFEWARSVVNVKPNNPWSGNVQLKAVAGVGEKQLKDDATIALRKAHYLKPRQGDDFAINSMTMFAGELQAFFSVLSIAGIVIGGFALIVGIFSVANIMFVSVKERTNIIGIKKALGAKKNAILLEFLIESILLCLIGGLIGLVFVWLILKLVSQISEFPIYLSSWNVIFTLLVSTVSGVLAGFIPAVQAAKMDPVEAMRA